MAKQKINKVVRQLKKASKTHAGQAKTLESIKMKKGGGASKVPSNVANPSLYRKAKADGSIKDERSKEAFFNRCDAFRVYSPLVELLRKKEFSECILDKYSGELRDLTSGRGIGDDDREQFKQIFTKI